LFERIAKKPYIFRDSWILLQQSLLGVIELSQLPLRATLSLFQLDVFDLILQRFPLPSAIVATPRSGIVGQVDVSFVFSNDLKRLQGV
jgi:hypothetical protein